MKSPTLGGALFLPTRTLEGEGLIRAVLAGRRHEGDLFIPTGRLYLTNLRVIWSPLFVYSWMRAITRPDVIDLMSITECTLSGRSLLSPVTPAIKLTYDGYPYWLYVGWSARSWTEHIDEAIANHPQLSGRS